MCWELDDNDLGKAIFSSNASKDFSFIVVFWETPSPQGNFMWMSKMSHLGSSSSMDIWFESSQWLC